MRTTPGISRPEEEQNLRIVLDIAQKRFMNVKASAKSLEDELHTMQQEFDESDKEQQALWHNTDARFQEMKLEIQRAGQARKKPYFGRIDFREPVSGKEEFYYVGRSVIADDPAHPEVIDWRAPIAGVYYESSLGETSYSVKGEGNYVIDLKRKRTYEIEEDSLKDFYDTDVVANDELLTKYLAKNKKAVLGEIIATIQKEQNEVIRKKPQHNLIIQGAAGSGKTTVAMHRISYILYNYDLEFKPEDFYVIGSNQVLLNYITGVLPELNVYGVCQMTMEQLFVRLLYEDWDPKKYRIKPVLRGVTEPVKGTSSWFRDLEQFTKEYEWSLIPRNDVVLEKNHVRLMSGDTITSLLERFDKLSRADKISLLSERLLGKLENEICGKYYSYSNEEKKKLRRVYANYFGKREWKGSIFELYREFLNKQSEKGKGISCNGEEFDIYDLAALSYLYKRIKETEIIREAGHVVIDEAQDFGMMAYCALKYCLSTCTYTIMGDVSQNIYLDYGLNDWQELRALMLPGEFDTFGLLRKSYRNTVEISDFATGILRHGSFYVYPVSPIIRHGEKVKILPSNDSAQMLEQSEEVIRGWQEKGYETIAVICPDGRIADLVSEELGRKLPILRMETEEMTFGNGVMVLPLEMTKGLEFDAVLLYDCSVANYPKEDGQVKRLYVAATRALHELTVLYQGELTGLIADPVEEGQELKTITEVVKPTRKPMPVFEEKTNAQIAIEQAQWGQVELEERHYIGPKRIEQSKELQKKSPAKAKGPVKAVATKKASDRTKVASYLEEQLSQGVSGKKAREKEEALQVKREREFGSMPEQKDLSVPGHARIDCGIKMCMKEKKAVNLLTAYGTLRVEAVGGGAIRVCFHREGSMTFPDAVKEFAGSCQGAAVRETKEYVELALSKISARVSKKTGEVSFWDKQGKCFLTESAKLPRQVEGNGSWTFFEWNKKTELFAKPATGQLPVRIGQSAKYISYGKESGEMPGLHASNGYELFFPAGRRTMCCTIPMYGPYVFQEGKESEYYFRIKEKV